MGRARLTWASSPLKSRRAIPRQPDMPKPTLLVLAAGMGSRYGGLKQMDPMGPNGETVIDYSVFDAIRGGFGKVVFVIRRDFEQAFRDGVGARFADQIEVDYAFQDLDALPEGFAIPAGREKPWGTGHAILCAREVIAEPFAVINADDFYGRDAYQQMADFLSDLDPDTQPEPYSMVGFKLANTLSDFGTVARGVCDIDAAGLLNSVKELTQIEKLSAGARHVEEDGSEISLGGDEIVSMNLWGFTPGVFAQLERLFSKFLRESGEELKSEFYIPFAVDELVGEKAATVTVLETSSSWFGVTYKEDRAHVVASIRALIDAGEYPESLRG